MRVTTKLLASLFLSVPLLADPAPARAANPPSVGVAISVHVAPPILPVYAQPICPGAGYLWQPGYWAYGDDDYYWVPGLWVMPPRVGFLWTPGYWGFGGGVYLWHAGYWGPTVGFYGGINYGFGYTGSGFYGGYWHGNQFFYNTRVMNVNRTVIHNVYNRSVVNERGANRVAYNGGPHGINARPTSEQLAAAHSAHVRMTSAQTAHERAARNDRNMQASVNHGRPDVSKYRNGAGNNRTPETRNRPVAAERPTRTDNRPNARSESRGSERTPERTPERRETPERSARPTPSQPRNESAYRTAPAAKPAARPAENEHRPAPTSRPAPRSSEHRAAPAPNTARPESQHRSAPTAKPEAQHHSAPASRPTQSHPEKPATHEQPHSTDRKP